MKTTQPRLFFLRKLKQAKLLSQLHQGCTPHSKVEMMTPSAVFYCPVVGWYRSDELSLWWSRYGGDSNFRYRDVELNAVSKGSVGPWQRYIFYWVPSSLFFAVLSSLSALNYFFHSTTRDERKPQNLAHCKWRFMLFTWHWQFYHPTFDKLSSQMNYLYSYMYNTLSLCLLLPAM